MNSVYFYNASFTNIQAQGRGGNLWNLNTNNELFVVKSAFEELDLKKNVDYGGIVHSEVDNKIVFSDSSVNKLDSLIGGCFYGNETLILISNSFFSNIFVDEDGGIFLLDLNNTLIILNTKFDTALSYSTAPYKGGAILYSGLENKIKINLCSFSSNIAQQGGAFFLISVNTFLIYKSEFSKNFAYSEGGVMSGPLRGGIIFISESSFYGSANEEYSYLSDTDSDTFSLGIEVVFIMKNINLDSIFSKKKSLFNFLSGNIAIFINVSIANIYTNYKAGAFYLYSLNQLYMKDVYFYNISSIQTEPNGAGVILVYDNNILVMSNSSTSISSTNSKSALIHSSFRNRIFIEFCVFADGLGLSFGGSGISAITQNKIIILNTNFRNFVSFDGGGVLSLGKNNSVYIRDGIFYNISDESENGGGVLLLSEQNEFIMIGCISHTSNSVNAGGGFAQIDLENKLIFRDILIMNSICNNGLAGGGFLSAYKGNSFFFSNVSTYLTNSLGVGGLLRLLSTNILICKECSVEENFAKREGGYLVAMEYNKILLKRNLFITVNIENEGSLGYFLSDNSLLIIDTQIRLEDLFPGNMIKLIERNRVRLTTSILTGEGKIARKFDFRYFLEITQLLEGKNLSKIEIDSSPSERAFSETMQTSSMLFSVSGVDNIIETKSVNFSTIDFSLIQIFKSNLLIKDCLFNAFNNAINYFIVADFSFIQIQGIIFTNTTNNPNFISTNLSSVTVLDSKLNLTAYKEPIVFLGFTCVVRIEGLILIIKTKLSYLSGEIFIFDTSSLIVTKFKYLEQSFFSRSVFLIHDCSFSLFQSQLISKSLTSLWSNQNLKTAPRFITAFFSNSTNSDEEMPYKVLLDRTSFTGKLGGGIFLSVKTNKTKVTFYAEKCIIAFNLFWRGTGGGAILSDGINNFILKAVVISANYAPYGGGIIFINKPTGSNITISKMLRNKAKFGGGLFADLTVAMNISAINNITKSNNFSWNSASGFGDDFASPQSKLRLSKITDSEIKMEPDEIYISQIRSGYNYSTCLFYLVPFDKFEQPCVNSDEQILSKLSMFKLTSEDPEIYENISTSYLSLFKDPSSTFYCTMGIIRRPELKENFTYKLVFNLKTEESSLVFKINMEFEKNCLIGERLAEDFSCVECESGRFSFQREFEDISGPCQSCASQNFYCFGGFNLTPRPGYWRVSSQSSNFVKCYQSAACLGDNRLPSPEELEYDENFASGVCAIGYKGMVCGECEDGWGGGKDYICIACHDVWFYFYLALMSVSQLVVVVYFVHQALIMCVSISSYKTDIDEVLSTYLIKLITNHFIIVAVFNKVPYELPQFLINVGEFLLNLFSIVNDNRISTECLMKSINVKWGSHYNDLMFIAFLPILIVILSLVYLALYNMTISKNNIMKTLNINKWDSLVCICNIVFVIIYPQMMQTCLETFLCFNFGEGNPDFNRLKKDLSVICWNDKHLFWILVLVFPLMVLIGFVFPLRVLRKVFLLKKQNKMISRKYLFKFGYFYFGYRTEYFYWEFVALFRKIAIIVVNIFVMSTDIFDISKKILIFMLIIAASLFLNYRKHPYENSCHLIYRLENKSLGSLLYSAFFVIFALKEGDYFVDINFKWACGLVASVSHLYFLIPWLLAFEKHFLRPRYLNILRIFRLIGIFFAKKKERIQVLNGKKMFFKGMHRPRVVSEKLENIFVEAKKVTVVQETVGTLGLKIEDFKKGIDLKEKEILSLRLENTKLLQDIKSLRSENQSLRQTINFLSANKSEQDFFSQDSVNLLEKKLQSISNFERNSIQGSEESFQSRGRGRSVPQKPKLSVDKIPYLNRIQTHKKDLLVLKRIESEEFLRPNIESGCLLDFVDSEKTPVILQQKFFENPVKEEIRNQEEKKTPTIIKEKLIISKPVLKDFILACLKDSHKIYECEHFSIQVTSTPSTSEGKGDSEGPRYLKMAILLENKKNYFAIEDINYKLKEIQNVLYVHDLKIIPFLGPLQTISLRFWIQILDMPYKNLQMELNYTYQDCKYQVHLEFPMSVNKFLNYLPKLSPRKYLRRNPENQFTLSKEIYMDLEIFTTINQNHLLTKDNDTDPHPEETSEDIGGVFKLQNEKLEFILEIRRIRENELGKIEMKLPTSMTTDKNLPIIVFILQTFTKLLEMG